MYHQERHSESPYEESIPGISTQGTTITPLPKKYLMTKFDTGQR